MCQNDVPDGTYKPEQDYIKSWNVSGLAEPTAEQLATYDNSGDTFETISKRVEVQEWCLRIQEFNAAKRVWNCNLGIWV